MSAFDLTPETEAAVLRIFELTYSRKDLHSGNGRLARNCFELAIRNHANRLVLQGKTDKESLQQLQPQDLPRVESLLPIVHPASGR